MTDQALKPKRDLATIQLGPEQNARLDIIADRFGVSRAQAARWIVDEVNPLTFMPSGRTVSTIEIDTNQEAA